MKDLSLHVLDILQNSTRAEATEIILNIIEDESKDLYEIMIKDNGYGMTSEQLERVTDPFFTTRTVRRVGLGIPLLKQNCEKTGGKFSIWSEKGVGTQLNAIFSHSHIDRPVLGDIASTVVLTAAAYPQIHFIYNHNHNGQIYTFDTKEINEILDGIPMNNPEIMTNLIEMIRENLREMGVEQ